MIWLEKCSTWIAKAAAANIFEKLALPVIKKTPKGQPSTNEAVLQELALDYPLPQVILRYRSLSKLKSTYTDQLPKEVRPDTGRLHTSYHQAVAAWSTLKRWSQPSEYPDSDRGRTPSQKGLCDRAKGH